jgi:hypothetical protein
VVLLLIDSLEEPTSLDTTVVETSAPNRNARYTTSTDTTAGLCIQLLATVCARRTHALLVSVPTVVSSKVTVSVGRERRPVRTVGQPSQGPLDELCAVRELGVGQPARSAQRFDV